ncbi:MAG: DUF72 domain-containing protein [Candidatus Nitrosocosmicus sp.]
MNLYVGCSGWSYKGWIGTFYPFNLENKNWLSYYSKFFKFVEVDSTFYTIPSRFVVRGWKDKTPDDFKFALKFPKIITHDKKMKDVSRDLQVFFSNLEPLIDKTVFLLIQLPPYLTENEGFDLLKAMINRRDRRFDYAIEFRDSSWFNDKVYDFLKNNKITLTWSIRDELRTPSIITSDQIYIRFIGDRSINDKDFGRIIKDRKKEMVEYADIVNEKTSTEKQTISIAFNNHYAGFGPESSSTFLKMMDKTSPDWTKELKQNENIDFSKENNHQTSIFDFPNYKS